MSPDIDESALGAQAKLPLVEKFPTWGSSCSICLLMLGPPPLNPLELMWKLTDPLEKLKVK
jgi:hypothetical protein